MGIMKLCLVLLLCMLAVEQWITCEASRKMLMEEEDGSEGFLHVSRKILSEEGEEANNMETELILPDEAESEQQEPLEKLEKKKKKKKHREDESMFPDSKDGDLLEEGSQDELAGGGKMQKKNKKKDYGDRERGKGDTVIEQETSGRLMGGNLGEEENGVRNVKKKVRNDMESLLIPGQTLEEDPEVLFEEASLSENAETAMETEGEAVLSEGGKDEDIGNTSREKLKVEQHSNESWQYREEGKPKKGKKEMVEEAVKAKKGKADANELFKSKALDDESLKGEAVPEETTDEVTPADAIEQEMQGGLEDLITQAVEEEKTAEEKEQAKEEAGITVIKEQESLENSKQTERAKSEKKSLKKPKTLKKLKSEGQVLEEEFKGSKFTDDKGMEKERSELQLKTKDKKKAKSSGKTEEGKSSEKGMQSDNNKKREDTKVSMEISNKIGIDATAQEDESMKKSSEVEKALKGTEDELPTVEKQEEKADVEVQSIAKDAQDRTEGFVTPKTSSTQGVNEDDEDYDFMQDFSDFSTNFQDMALKVADHLSPNIHKLTDTSKVYFSKANQQIKESFSPVVGKQFAPFFASVVSYGLLLIPLVMVILIFEHIRALLSLQKVLLFVNIYLSAYFATLLLATFVLGEPMNFFYKSSASGYVHLQLLQALGYIIYLILQTFDLVFRLTSETFPMKVTVVLQWLVAFAVGFHYYVTIFHRAMASKGPHTNWKIYGIYSIAFLVLCLFARIKRVKKGYMQLGQADTDKKH